MLNLIFDCSHEQYLLIFKPEALTFKQTFILALKMFINILALSLVFTLPIAVCLGFAYLVSS